LSYHPAPASFPRPALAPSPSEDRLLEAVIDLTRPAFRELVRVLDRPDALKGWDLFKGQAALAAVWGCLPSQRGCGSRVGVLFQQASHAMGTKLHDFGPQEQHPATLVTLAAVLLAIASRG
jgi:hypothetical protein